LKTDITKTTDNPEKGNNTKLAKQNKTSLVESLLTTLSQQMRWAYSTMLPNVQSVTESRICNMATPLTVIG